MQKNYEIMFNFMSFARIRFSFTRKTVEKLDENKKKMEIIYWNKICICEWDRPTSFGVDSNFLFGLYAESRLFSYIPYKV